VRLAATAASSATNVSPVIVGRQDATILSLVIRPEFTPDRAAHLLNEHLVRGRRGRRILQKTRADDRQCKSLYESDEKPAHCTLLPVFISSPFPFASAFQAFAFIRRMLWMRLEDLSNYRRIRLR